MELKRVRCTQCGAEFENTSFDGRTVKCTRLGCGAVFYIEKGERFLDVEEERAEKIRELRSALRAASRNKQYEVMRERALDIQAMMPDDFVANFMLALVEKAQTGKPAKYEGILVCSLPCTPAEAEECAEVAISHYDVHSEASVDAFIRNRFEGDVRARLLSKLSDAAYAWKSKQDDYSNIPRDVFICHSSSDAAVADRVYEALKREGFSCWSSRVNLPPDTRDYSTRIRNAIENCRLMVVIASEQCMLREDPRMEIERARSLGKLLVEFKIDKVEHTEAFKYYFKGRQWVDGTKLSEKQYGELVKRVARELVGGEKAERREEKRVKEEAPPKPREPEIRYVEKKPEKKKGPTMGERLQKLNASIRHKKARRIVMLKKSRRLKIGKTLLFFALIAYAILFLINYADATYQLLAIADQFPSVMRVNSAIRDLFKEVNSVWPESFTTGSLPLYRTPVITAVSSLAVVVMMLPFTRLAVKRACSLMMLSMIVCAGVYVANVVMPIMDIVYFNMESSIVLVFKHMWPMVLAYIVLMVVNAFAKKSVKRIAAAEKIVAENNGGV